MHPDDIKPNDFADEIKRLSPDPESTARALLLNRTMSPAAEGGFTGLRIMPPRTEGGPWWLIGLTGGAPLGTSVTRMDPFNTLPELLADVGVGRFPTSAGQVIEAIRSGVPLSKTLEKVNLLLGDGAAQLRTYEEAGIQVGDQRHGLILNICGKAIAISVQDQDGAIDAKEAQGPPDGNHRRTFARLVLQNCWHVDGERACIDCQQMAECVSTANLETLKELSE